MIWNSAMWLRNRLVTSCAVSVPDGLTGSFVLHYGRGGVSFVLKQEGQRSLDGICDGQTTCMRPITSAASKVEEFPSSAKVPSFQQPLPVQAVQRWYHGDGFRWHHQVTVRLTYSYTILIKQHSNVFERIPWYYRFWYFCVGVILFWSSRKHVQITSRNVKKYNFIYLFTSLNYLLIYLFTYSFVYLLINFTYLLNVLIFT